MMVRPGRGGKPTTPDFRPLPACLLAVLWLALAPTGGHAFLLDDSDRLPCAMVLSGAVGKTPPACSWTFQTIALEQSESGAGGSSESRIRLSRAGFATSDLTIEETVAGLSDGPAALLTWDRQVGIVRELAIDMALGVEANAFSAPHFLLMPAAFNSAFLADFVDFTACQTAHTFIFTGALDGRSDAPYVTKRWSAMKVPVCLEMEGADCSATHPGHDPARMYFRIDYQCRYMPQRD